MTLDPDRVDDLVDDLCDTLTDADAAHIVARALDALIPADELLPGPVGALVERHDGDVVLALIDWIGDLVRDPERRARRRERRDWIAGRTSELRAIGHKTQKARALAVREWRTRS